MRFLIAACLACTLIGAITACGDVKVDAALPSFTASKSATVADPGPDVATAKKLADLAHQHMNDALKVEADSKTISQLRDQSTALHNLRDLDAAESARLASKSSDENKALAVINASLRDKETLRAMFWTIIGGSLLALVGVGIVFGLGGTTLIGPLLARAGKFAIAIGIGLDVLAIITAFLYARVLPWIEAWGMPVAVVAAASVSLAWLIAHRGHLATSVLHRLRLKQTLAKVTAAIDTAHLPEQHPVLAEIRDDLAKHLA